MPEVRVLLYEGALYIGRLEKRFGIEVLAEPRELAVGPPNKAGQANIEFLYVFGRPSFIYIGNQLSWNVTVKELEDAYNKMTSSIIAPYNSSLTQ